MAKDLEIDKGFEVYSPYKSKCSECKHFDSAELNCSAFPSGIPKRFLSGYSVHDKVIEGQTGTDVLTLF